MEKRTDMEETISKLHAQWGVVRERAAVACERAGRADVAEKYRSCGMFKGTEDIGGLVDLLTSPQGAELCLRHGFPSLAAMRLFKPFRPERHGAYVDAGEITLENPARAVLAGRTVATVDCDAPGLHEIFLFHGAKAVIKASGLAVVAVNAMRGCRVIREVSGNAIIL